jgi:hypothetical protein
MPSPKLAAFALRLAAHTTDTLAGSEYLTPPARSSTEVSMFVVEDGGVETSAAPNRYIAFRRRSSEVGQIVTNFCKNQRRVGRYPRGRARLRSPTRATEYKVGIRLV